MADLLERLWTCYQGLKRGDVGDLGAPGVPHGHLEVLLGLGSTVFSLPQRPANAPACPAAMRQSFAQPVQGGGGPISGNAGILYENDVAENPADAAIALQFTARTPLAVERAIVESWKLLHDDDSPALEIRAVFYGTKRDDGRSWIDFHDGLSNLSQAERPGAILIPPPATPGPPEQDAWTAGGTYLAFMRLYIDLAVWRSLSVARQEELVGREKLSGLPLSALGHAFGQLGPHGEPPHEADASQLPVYTPLDATMRTSHIQRANHQDPFPGGSASPTNHRIFRQGYPFLEPRDSPPGFRVGLNFVSFQSTPANLTGMLGQVGWLGGTNFGGADVDPVVVLSARAAGFFLVAPVEGTERFPGRRALTGPQP